MISTNVLYRSTWLLLNCFDVNTHFQPSVFISEVHAPPDVFNASFCISSASVLLNLAGWIYSGILAYRIS